VDGLRARPRFGVVAQTTQPIERARGLVDRLCARFPADDVRAAWLVDAETVGLTAGTSTPDGVIDAVEQRLRALAALRASYPLYYQVLTTL
jgi:4-hydroxy-3-methylbut-2-enyl diphosphate reductase IspH